MRELKNEDMLQIDLDSTNPMTRCYAKLVRSVARTNKPTYGYVEAFENAQLVGINEYNIDRAIRNGHELRQKRDRNRSV